MTNITLIKGDDTNFNEQVFLVVSFKTNLDLTGYTAKLTVENPTNILKKYEVQHNAFQIDFDKTITNTLEIGKHKASVKLYDTQNRIKTVYNFEITVQDEFNASVPFLNEYEIEVIIDNEGISKYKNYDELHNKPQINDVVLEGNKNFDDLGMTKHMIGISEEGIRRHNTEDPIAHKDIRDQIMNKQDRLIAGANITIIDGIISSLGAEGGITTNYKHLGNKPKINNVVLDDNITLEQLGVQPLGEYITEETLNQKGYLTTVPSGYITEEELQAENFLKEVPVEYFTDEQNAQIYATKEDLNTKQNVLTAGENITITQVEDELLIEASVPSEYITDVELLEYNYVDNDTVNKRLSKKQNIILAGDNIRMSPNNDGTYTISAIDSKNPASISSYNALNNKPTINGVTLTGNKTPEDLQLQPAGNYQKALTAGEHIEIQEFADGRHVIKVVVPDYLCTDNELDQGLAEKADKATTLNGYNIEDAYTKEEVDTLVHVNINEKVTDIILEAPNGVANYTENTLTAQSGLTVLVSNGLTVDNRYVNDLYKLEEDLILDVTNLEYNEDYKEFYLALVYDDTLHLNIIPKSMYHTMFVEYIPNTTTGYIKNINENKVYQMVTEGHGIYMPQQVKLKLIGEGILKQIDGVNKITSFSPYSVYRLINQDELLAQLNGLQHNITVGENFTFVDNKLEYRIPFNYVTKEYLIENDFATQTDVNDRVDVHNLNDLSHQDIREEISNVRSAIPTTNDYCTRQEYNRLLDRIVELENKIKELTK
jgi:hypothetical protein